MMKAIQITAFGGPDVMKLIDCEDPIVGEGQELIDVTAIGINYADTHQTENSYLSPQKLPLIPGIEVVGKTAAGVLLPSAPDAACGRQRPDRSCRTGDRLAYRQNHRRKLTTGCRFHHI